MLKPRAKINLKELKEKERALQIGVNLWHIRKSKNISQQKLAIDANITQNIISKIEDGSYNPGSNLLVKLANALGISESILLTKNIDWQANEILDIILKRAREIGKDYLDVLGITKLFYFIDLYYKEEIGVLLRNTKYTMYKAGPYDDSLHKGLNNINNAIFYCQSYELQEDGREYLTFELKNNGMEIYTILDYEDINRIHYILDEFIGYDSIKLRELSYETEPMKNINATFCGDEGMYTVILENK